MRPVAFEGGHCSTCESLCLKSGRLLMGITAIKSFEGKVRAVVFDGLSFVTSLNTDVIYAPPPSGRMTYNRTIDEVSTILYFGCSHFSGITRISLPFLGPQKPWMRISRHIFYSIRPWMKTLHLRLTALFQVWATYPGDHLDDSGKLWKTLRKKRTPIDMTMPSPTKLPFSIPL